MKKKLRFSETLTVGCMLFGLFFGAGNLIFPVYMGQQAGANLWSAAIGFLITGVGIPLLGVAALGMSRSQTYWYIIIPQTVRRLIPLSINLITRMIKTTSLVLMIGVVEVIKVAQQIIEANRTASPNAAFGIYLTVFVLYFLACWPISLLASYLEKKWK